MSAERVLVVDDERISRDFLADALSVLGLDVSTAQDGAEAIERLANDSFDQVWTDLQMPGRTGAEVLQFAKERDADRPVVVVTAHGTMHVAVELMRGGADDILEKPATIEDLELSLCRVRERSRLRRENRFHRERAVGAPTGLIAESGAMRDVLATIDRVANSDAAVLISGESGTGKERIAAEVHRRSHRSERPFVELNAAAIPDHLAESEFFGHEAGSFTSAQKRRIGCFEMADGGSLFLDELGEMPQPLQAKLLRVLQEGTFRRVGGERTLSADVRVIAATNRDLEQDVRDGRFREDLFYRLNVVPIRVPPLRERPEDLLPLLRHFLGNEVEVTDAARDAVLGHHWPGNVRELQNRLERARLLCEGGVVDVTDLGLGTEAGPGPSGPQGAVDPIEQLVGRSLRDVENALIERTLERLEGHRTLAAKQLGIGVRTLYDRLQRLQAASERR